MILPLKFCLRDTVGVKFVLNQSQKLLKTRKKINPVLERNRLSAGYDEILSGKLNHRLSTDGPKKRPLSIFRHKHNWKNLMKQVRTFLSVVHVTRLFKGLQSWTK